MRFSPMAVTALSLRRCGTVPPSSLPQHGYPGVAEIGNPFEERACCQVAAHVQYAPSFIQQVDAVFHFLAEYVQRHSELGGGSSSPVSK